MLFTLSDIPVDILKNKAIEQKGVMVSVLRLDKMNSIASGNKLFKLHYFLEEALQSLHKTILTFGGAYSNHLVATAFTCNQSGLKSIGIIRGEQPAILSHTLQQCLNYGMHLKFVSREIYSQKEELHFLNQLKSEFGDCTIIPEGGFSTTGASGASLIWKLIPQNLYTHICTAIGTATTIAGLLQGAGTETIIGIPVLKSMFDISQRIIFCNGSINQQQLQFFNEYHFGGYAKKTPELITFMNQLWQQHQLPTDFVYTAKLFFAVFDKIKNNYFPPGSHILCLHTGGLQGNLSLEKGTLVF